MILLPINDLHRIKLLIDGFFEFLGNGQLRVLEMMSCLLRWKLGLSLFGLRINFVPKLVFVLLFAV